MLRLNDIVSRDCGSGGAFIDNKEVVRAWADNFYDLYQAEPVFACVIAECADGKQMRLRSFPWGTILVVKEEPC